MLIEMKLKKINKFIRNCNSFQVKAKNNMNYNYYIVFENGSGKKYYSLEWYCYTLNTTYQIHNPKDLTKHFKKL